MLIMLTALLGGCGALVRVLLLQLCAHVHTFFPLGTLTVNIIACLTGGIFAALPLTQTAQLLLIGGLIGGLGTLSSICSDSINLLRAEKWLLLALYLILSAICGLAAAALGCAIGRGLA